MSVKLKRIAIVLLTCIMLLTTFFAPAYQHNVYADSGAGTLESAQKRLLVDALTTCILYSTHWNGSIYSSNGKTFYEFKSQDLKSGRWFKSGGLVISYGGTIISDGGIYAEYSVTGKADDGKIYCHENNNALVNKTIEALNIDITDVICDNFGVETGYSCKDELKNDKGKFYLPYDAKQKLADYFRNIVGDQLNNDNYWLERYLIYNWIFSSFCKGSKAEGSSGSAYTITEFNDDTKEFEQKYYYAKRDFGPNREFYDGFSGIETTTCNEIANSLNMESSSQVMKAFIQQKNAVQISSCIDKYNDELANLKKYRGNYNIYELIGKNFYDTVKQMLDSYQNGWLADTSVSGDEVFSRPLAGSYKRYIESKLPNVVRDDENNPFRNNNAFTQLANAALYILEQSEISDEGEVKSSVGEQYIEQAKDWANKVYGIIDTSKTNRSKINNFIDEHELEDSDNIYKHQGSIWDYKDKDKKMGIECVGLARLDDEWNRFRDENGIDGAPDVDGEFEGDDYSITDELATGLPGSVVSDPCSDASGSMSWILCPIMKKATDNAIKIYENMVEPFLQVKPAVLSENTTRNVWTVMVGIANTAVVVFLLVIVFSQLTGVGIDNYNIKKSLPKIIVVAVLVNMSYLVCQLAVDVSNIAGNGLNSMLSSVNPLKGESLIIKHMDYSTRDEEDKVNEALENGKSGNNAAWFKTVLDVAVAAAGVGGIASIISGISSSGWFAGLVLPVILLLITVLFAVMFFFILMGIRQAGVVMLVILSPLAMVCYMLPNTKKYFDKWKKAFGGLLLLYPICGVLIGGGQLTSKILLSADSNYLMYFVGCIIMVAPFFMIPSMLKGSMAAMGNIGAKISGLGKTLGSRSRGAMDKGVRNNKAFQDRVKFNQEQAALRRANRVHKRLSAKGEENLNERQLMKLKAADDTIIGHTESVNRAKNMAGSGYATALAGAEAKVDAQRDADADALLNLGKASYLDEHGNSMTVNPGNVKDVGSYHAAALKKYHNAKTDTERANALSEIKAAQKLLSRTDGGRALVQNNLTDAIAQGYGSGLNQAATHLQSNFGDTYKAKNRGANNLINDLAGGVDIEKVREGLTSGSYELAGADKYDQTSLVNADDLALKSMANAVSRIQEQINSGDMPDAATREQFNQIKNTATKAIEMYNAGRLSVKPEVLRQIEDIAGVQAKRSVAPTDTPQPTSGSDSGSGSSGTPGGEAGSSDPTRLDLDHAKDRIYNNENYGGGNTSEL